MADDKNRKIWTVISSKGGDADVMVEKEVGYVTDRDAVFGLGHAGIFIELDNGYYVYFEVNNLREEDEKGKPVVGEEKTEEGTENEPSIDYNCIILSKSLLKSPTPGSALKVEMGEYAGVIRRDFTSRSSMKRFLGAKPVFGNGNGYESMLIFRISSAQRDIILKEAERKAGIFADYAVIGNSCGIWGRDVLTVSGSGIESKLPERIQIIRQMSAAIDPLGNLLSKLMNDNAPNSIAAELILANPDTYFSEDIK
jgi:hypothetical protein